MPGKRASRKEERAGEVLFQQQRAKDRENTREMEPRARQNGFQHPPIEYVDWLTSEDPTKLPSEGKCAEYGDGKLFEEIKVERF